MNDHIHLAAEYDQNPSRELPHSVEAEQAILGGLLNEPRAWVRVSDLVVESDFFRADHRLIFKAIARLLEEGRALDVVTAQEALDRAGDLSNAGGLAYLKELSDNTPSVANIASFARVVSERSQFRKIIGVCGEIEQSASSPNGRTAEDLVHDAESKMLSVAGQRPKEGGPVGIDTLLRKAVEKIESVHESGLESLGQSTGFVDLDSKLSLLRPADLVIVAGRPSMGKTTFAMNIVEEAVLRSEKVVVVYSMEMPGDALLTRMLSSMGSIDQSRVRSGKLLNEDWTKLTKAANALNKNDRFFIDDTPALSPSEMRSRTRRLRRVHGEIGLIMVDYLQLMQIPGYGGLNRTNEISAISRSLKALAKEFDCPVIALSQLNRSVEQRKDKRPVNSDLRESGAIEQDADVILFVYRDEVYNPDSRFAGTAEIIIGKQREGPTGFVRLGFEGRYTRFVNLMPGTHDFTDQEMGVEMIDPHSRLGRMPVQKLAEEASKKVEGKGRGRRRKGSRKPP
ncbi:replicative DNA helicase [Pseudomonas sp. NBRC 111139]|uniref:replicative DNA helicase n=1 Tax=Pseudomonas sp. NBRC 111139 TaxID=1661054 RepID=UPI0008637194|nr:replicative DNA helicase [Pseudomonas sp. NBRC 111139]